MKKRTDTQNLSTEGVDLWHSYLIGLVGRQFYGFSVSVIHSVRRLDSLTSVPFLPDYFAGVINLHSEIIPVVDGVKLFDERSADPEETPEVCLILGLGKEASELVAIKIRQVFEVVEVANFNLLEADRNNMKPNSLVKAVYRWNKIPVKLVDGQKLLERL